MKIKIQKTMTPKMKLFIGPAKFVINLPQTVAF